MISVSLHGRQYTTPTTTTTVTVAPPTAAAHMLFVFIQKFKGVDEARKLMIDVTRLVQLALQVRIPLLLGRTELESVFKRLL